MSRSPLLPIFLTVFVDVLGLTLMLPLLPFYAERFGADAQTATMLISSFAACQLISGPILGQASDRMGRKPVLLVSQAGTFLAFLIIARADAYPSIGLWMLFAGRMLDGLTAGNLTIAQAYISDVTRPENRTRAFGLIGIAFGSGYLFGPMFSSELSHRYGFSAPVYMAAALSLLSIVLSSTLLPGRDEIERIKAEFRGPASTGEAGDEPPAGKRTLAFGRFFSQPLPRRRLLQFFAFTTSFAVLTGGLGLFLERQAGFHYTVRETGWVYGVAGLVGGTTQGALRPLVKRFGEARLARIGFVAMVVAYAFLGAVHTVPELLAIVVVGSFGAGVVRPCLTTLLTKSVGRHEQGAAMGTNQSLSSIAQMVGPGMAGFVIQHSLLWAYGVVAGVFALAGVVLSRKPDPAPEPDALPGAVSEEKASV